MSRHALEQLADAQSAGQKAQTYLQFGYALLGVLTRRHQPVAALEVHLALVSHNPPDVFPPYRGYVHAVEVAQGSRHLFISGLNGFESDGKTMPESFEEQAELIWKHLRTILRSAGMDVSNLVSLRTYLADPKYDEANARMREKQLGSHRVAATVVCCRLLEPAWKLEIEAVAAA